MKRKISYPAAALRLFLLIGAALAGRLVSGGSAALAQSLGPDERFLADRISIETIREITVRLTADDLEGRGTAEPGGIKAAHWLADRFAQLGLEPLGCDGTYLQAIPFQRVRVHVDFVFENRRSGAHVESRLRIHRAGTC